MNRFDCPVCRKVFSTPHGRDSHLGRCIQGGQLQERARLAAQPAVQRLELAGADAAKEELQRAADSSNLQTMCGWLSLATKMRCTGVSDGLISDVRWFVGSLLARVNATVKSYLSATAPADIAELAKLVDDASLNGSEGWPHGVHTTPLEQALRRGTMPHVEPVERVMHKYDLTVTLPDGRAVNTVQKRSCTDVPALDILARLLETDHRVVPKIRASAKRLGARAKDHSNGKYPPLRDTMDGSVVRDHPATPMAIRGEGSADHPYVLYFCLAWDEIGLENPLGPHHNNHDVMMVYWVCLCFDLDFRLQKHMIQLQTIALGSDVKQLSFQKIIGDLDDVPGEPKDTTSWAASMRALDPRGPARAFTYAETDPPAAVRDQKKVHLVGVHVLGITDSPAGSLATSTKTTFGPQTRRCCRQCYAGQGVGPRNEGTHFQQLCAECGDSLDDEVCLPWTHRTRATFDSDKAAALGMGDTAREAFMIEKGWTDFNLAFEKVWGFDPFRGTPEDIMHMFPEGTSSTQLAATLYLLMVKYGVETGLTLDKLNDLIANFPWPKQAASPAYFLDSVRHGVEGNKPSPECGLKLTAAATHTLVLHSVELLRSVIPQDCKWPCWQAWLLHVEVYTILQTRVIYDDPAAPQESTITILNMKLREHWEAFEAVEEFEGLCRTKNHFQTHMPVDGRRWGPWKGFSALHFELFHMRFKGWGRACNFKNAPWTLASRWAEWSAYGLWTRAHMYKQTLCAIGTPIYTERVTEPASSPLLQAVLRTAGCRSADVKWCREFAMGTKIVSGGDWLYVTPAVRSADCPEARPELCQVVSLFEIGSITSVSDAEPEIVLLLHLLKFKKEVLQRSANDFLPFAFQSELGRAQAKQIVIACKTISVTLLTAVPTTRENSPCMIFFEH